MFEAKNSLDELVKNLLGALPQGVADLREDTRKNFRATLAAGLQHLDLVTRAEFDAQRAVLDKAREEIRALHARVDELVEAQNKTTK